MKKEKIPARIKALAKEYKETLQELDYVMQLPMKEDEVEVMELSFDNELVEITTQIIEDEFFEGNQEEAIEYIESL